MSTKFLIGIGKAHTDASSKTTMGVNTFGQRHPETGEHTNVSVYAFRLYLVDFYVTIHRVFILHFVICRVGTLIWLHRLHAKFSFASEYTEGPSPQRAWTHMAKQVGNP